MPMGTSIIRFSTTPDEVTRTTRARPGPSDTNSICFKGSTTLGATTRPAQWDSPDSSLVGTDAGELAGIGGNGVEVSVVFGAKRPQLDERTPQRGLTIEGHVP